MAQQAGSLPLAATDHLRGADRGDEIGQLARAFNGLLARLRTALRTQRQFMADASHELRTPVSVIRTAADVALSRESRSEADYRERGLPVPERLMYSNLALVAESFTDFLARLEPWVRPGATPRPT